MALTPAITAPSTNTDKGIFAAVSTAVTIFYTVPEGRKFIGNALMPASSFIRVNGVNYSAGTGGSGLVFPLTLLGGQSVEGYQMTLNGIESDA